MSKTLYSFFNFNSNNNSINHFSMKKHLLFDAKKRVTRTLFCIALILVCNQSFAQIAAWDFSGQTSPVTFAATTFARMPSPTP
jgi:hypothetical protein